MSKQRYVQDSFWTDPYIESLNIEEKLLFLYYLTNPLCNVAGIYEIRDNRVSYETKIKEETIKIIKNKFVKDKKILIFKDWILFINFAKNQSPNPNVLIGMQRIIDRLPRDVKALKGFERLSHFTLLNLTYISQNKKSMKTINYDTQEEIQPKDKRTKLTKEENNLLIAVGVLWTNLVKKNTKLEEDEIPVKNLVNFIRPIYLKHKWKYEDFKGLFEHWFKTTKEENKPNFHFCLTEQNIAKYKIQKKMKDTPKTLSQMSDEIRL